MTNPDFSLEVSHAQLSALAKKIYEADRGIGRLTAWIKAVRLLDSVQNSGAPQQ